MIGKDELLAQLNSVLDKYENELALPKLQFNNEATELLALTRNQIEKMTPEECGSGSYILAQYSFSIQRALNRELTVVNWAKSYIDSLIANELQQYNVYSFEERKLLAINNNEIAKLANKIKVSAQSRIDRLSYIAGKIELMGRTLENLQISKRKRYESN